MSRNYALAAAAAFGVEVYIALAVHDGFVRPFLGDALAVILVYLLLRAASGLDTAAAASCAVAVAFLIELGQFAGLLGLLGLAGNPVARVVLGTDFDPKDFLAYLAGGVAVVGAELLRGAARSISRPC